jgi:hypothetical protein
MENYHIKTMIRAFMVTKVYLVENSVNNIYFELKDLVD